MLIVGLTGGIGCGKSTVTEYFTAQGVDVVDADKVAGKLLAKGQPALQEVVNVFGSDLFQMQAYP